MKTIFTSHNFGPRNWRLESRQNPQAGKPALRSADIPVRGFRGLSSPRSNRMARSCQGISLVEMLVYMSVLIVIVGVGYTALYRCLDNSNALRRSADDIANALHTGEDWRADVRAADGKIQLESLPDEQILHLPGSRGEVSYRFAANAISRRLGNNEWSPLLANVQTSTFVADTRTKANAWRWEIELQTRTKKFGTVKPLFTFIAVPAGELPK